MPELVDQAQRVLSGRTAEEIRNNQNLREQIRQNMASIEETISEVFNQPRRKIGVVFFLLTRPLMGDPPIVPTRNIKVQPGPENSQVGM